MTVIRKQLIVEAPAERAYRVFAQSMGTWWPKSHHIGKSPLRDCVVEPRVGGRWYEVCEDGSECDWGKVLVWDPPRRLVLAWQLDAQFTYDPAFSTEVEVTFTVLAPTRTRVDFEHRQLERFGDTADRLFKDMGDGWGQILDSFARNVAA
jgi:uncharacterized protein YndB with AHSA1/START domain